MISPARSGPHLSGCGDSRWWCRHATVFVMLVMVWILGTVTVPALDICDDFGDGSFADGQPLAWIHWRPGTYDATSGDLVMSDASERVVFAQIDGLAIEGDVSIRTRVRLEGFNRSYAWIRRSDRPGDAYLGLIGFGWMLLETNKLGGDKALRRRLLSVEDPDDQDFFVQLDVRPEVKGTKLELRVWRPGESFPVEAQLTDFDDDPLPGPGAISLGVTAEADPTVRGTFRFIQVSNTMIDDTNGIENRCGSGRDLNFRRGDGNTDGNTNIADPVYILNHLFGGGPAPSCLQTADANDDNAVDIADPVYQLNHLFGGGPALAAPVGECGTDPTPAVNAEDDLPCEAYSPCEA